MQKKFTLLRYGFRKRKCALESSHSLLADPPLSVLLYGELNDFYALQTCTVDLPGGPLEIEWREADNHVYMTGPAEAVFYGSVPL